jgi:hypothetical protein
MKISIIKQTILKVFCMFLLLFIIIKSFAVPTNFAPKIQEAKVKAAMIYQIIKMINWPDKKTNLSICIIGEESYLGNELLKMNRKISEGRQLSIIRRSLDSPIERLCDAIVIQDESINHVKAILKKINYNPILSISDISNFTKQGGILELYKKGDQIKFLINEDIAKQTNLHMDSKLIKLAK